MSSGLPLRLHRDLASASAPGLPYLHLSGGRGKGGLLVSQYSLLGAHDPAWLTLLLLSSGAAIHHDTGDRGGQKYSQRAQYMVIRHNGNSGGAIQGAKRGMAVAGPRMEDQPGSASPTLPLVRSSSDAVLSYSSRPFLGAVGSAHC